MFEEGPRLTAESRSPTAPERVACARPELDHDAPEFRAAVVLVLVAEIGFNVDRIVARTKYPRDFVARTLRRLVDNGLRVDGRLATTWSLADLSSDDFWLDVQVALGRYLRRNRPGGTPEWAPAGEWLKNFDYRVRGDSADGPANEYHPIDPHDSEPRGETADGAVGGSTDVPASSVPRLDAGALDDEDAADTDDIEPIDRNPLTLRVGADGLLIDGRDTSPVAPTSPSTTGHPTPTTNGAGNPPEDLRSGDLDGDEDAPDRPERVRPLIESWSGVDWLG